MPFDQNTVIGFFGELLYDIISAETYFITSSVILLVVSMCQHHQAFLKMFRHSLRKLGDGDQNQNDEELLCKLIEFHISVKK